MSALKQILDEQETRIESPFKTHPKTFRTENQPSNHLALEQIELTENMSKTQSELYSKSIVRKLLKATKSKTIRHQINQIDKQSSLYARPIRPNPTEFLFNNIPSAHPTYASSCSAKIKQINQGLHPKRLTPNKQNRYNSNFGASTEEKGQQRVSVSGLVTYKFNSVKSQRSLGFSSLNYEQRLKEQATNCTKMCECSNSRLKTILQKKSRRRYHDGLRKEQNILSNFECSTQQYLKQIISDNEQQMLVYGEKAKKLNFIKEYMISEETQYSEGRYIVDQIQKAQPKEPQNRQRRVKTQLNDDLLIKQRRMPAKDKRIKIRFLTFND